MTAKSGHPTVRIWTRCTPVASVDIALAVELDALAIIVRAHEDEYEQGFWDGAVAAVRRQCRGDAREVADAVDDFLDDCGFVTGSSTTVGATWDAAARMPMARLERLREALLGSVATVDSN